jgi:hypothetical protein
VWRWFPQSNWDPAGQKNLQTEIVLYNFGLEHHAEVLLKFT